MIEFRGVGKVYARPGGGPIEVLSDASFDLGAGELAVVSGPSGAGKTTLLRLISGEERATRGAVLVDGADVGGLGHRALARLRRRLGIVPQDGGLLHDRSVFGNVAFVLRALGVPRREGRERARDALRAAGLAARATALPVQLARGECRRLLLARALAIEPDLVLADEPTAALDDTAAEEMLALLRGAHGRGATVLVATCAPGLARRLGGRALSLEQGRVRAEAAPA